MKNKEILRMQQLAGLLTESEVRNKMNEGPQYRPVSREEYEKIKNEIDWGGIDPSMDNRPDFKQGSVEGTTPDGREFVADATWTEFDGLDIDEDSVEEYLGWENK